MKREAKGGGQRVDRQAEGTTAGSQGGGGDVEEEKSKEREGERDCALISVEIQRLFAT